MIPSSACPPRHPDQQRPAPNTTATASDSYTTWWDTIVAPGGQDASRTDVASRTDDLRRTNTGRVPA
jgi:hypothetical protein